MEALVPTYLEQAMQNFVESQEQMSEQMEKSFGDMMPISSIPAMDQVEGITKQNMEIMQNMMQMFTQFPQNPSNKKSDD